MRTLAGIRQPWGLGAGADAGLTLARADDLRGIPQGLTVDSMTRDILLEVALPCVRKVWITAIKQPEAFFILQRELEAFYRRFQLTGQKPITAFRMA